MNAPFGLLGFINRSAERRVAAPALVLLLLGGCNLLTGADEFTIGDGGSGGETDASTGNVGASDVSGPGAGGHSEPGAGGSAGVGGTAGAGGTGGGPVQQEGDATGVTISEVAFYQALKSTVWKNGSPQAPSVSLVANRPAVVRVFASASGASGAPLTARLTLGGNPPIETTVTSFGNNSDSSYGSTVNFDVPAEYMTGGNWKVEFKEPATSSQGPNPNASTGESSLQLRSSKTLKVTLIPVQYQADGSNRMPDTSAGQVELYRQSFMAVYPTTDVIVNVGPTLAWSNSISAGGGGWETVLNAVTDERTSSNADFDEYYFGIFNPTSSFNNYCAGGCMLGLGWIGGPNAEYTRAAVGIGFSGEISTSTAVHEVGHNHGRDHSPCGGVSGADPNYPHSGGNIGVWGMDIIKHDMVPPSHKDFMTYCDPTWISDYTYENILDFMAATNSLEFPESSLNQMYERLSVGADSAAWLNDVQLARPPLGDEVSSITLSLADGSTKTVSGNFYRYDHLPGGVIYVKKEAQAIQALQVEIDLNGQQTLIQAHR